MTVAEYSADMEFKAWPKLARLHRDIVITEKVDCTNACVVVTQDENWPHHYKVGAQSRNKALGHAKRDRDSFGFAHWVSSNADALATLLGPGYHYGEWYGKGIQRGYDMQEKRFALFNTEFAEFDGSGRTPDALAAIGVDTVPLLGTYPARDLNMMVNIWVEELRRNGSMLVNAVGYRRPEGIVVYHRQGNVGFKVTLENDEMSKGEAERRGK